ncbi:hypothetical protein QR98_0084220 [Sarcoptes scabiei]|uniref:Uncharacterized protein n=1 Tax=Sarcoptes scabiei TaxID=52283 RepID=A0A132AFW6_SARSC|nr:hypothetical protein QR98_0084220 [Sarcoptes scabiei]
MINNRRWFQATGLFLVTILVLELILISDHITSVQASKKKKIMKKLKDILPLLMMMKGKKKILIPIPIPLP